MRQEERWHEWKARCQLRADLLASVPLLARRCRGQHDALADDSDVGGINGVGKSGLGRTLKGYIYVQESYVDRVPGRPMRYVRISDLRLLVRDLQKKCHSWHLFLPPVLCDDHAVHPRMGGERRHLDVFENPHHSDGVDNLAESTAQRLRQEKESWMGQWLAEARLHDRRDPCVCLDRARSLQELGSCGQDILHHDLSRLLPWNLRCRLHGQGS